MKFKIFNVKSLYCTTYGSRAFKATKLSSALQNVFLIRRRRLVFARFGEAISKSSRVPFNRKLELLVKVHDRDDGDKSARRGEQVLKVLCIRDKKESSEKSSSSLAYLRKGFFSFSLRRAVEDIRSYRETP